MYKTWEIRKVSTPGQILERIRKETPGPVGIVVCGIDGDFKRKVIIELEEELREFMIYFGVPSIPALVDALQEHSVVVAVLDSNGSVNKVWRREMVRMMRKAGAASVVGVYTKCKISNRGRPKTGVAYEAERFKSIANSVPTADELDYLIAVSEK